MTMESGFVRVMPVLLIKMYPNIALNFFEAGKKRQRTMPVSYTHLRAHETVLDLVCRLLLEKKKHKEKKKKRSRHRANTATQ